MLFLRFVLWLQRAIFENGSVYAAMYIPQNILLKFQYIAKVFAMTAYVQKIYYRRTISQHFSQFLCLWASFEYFLKRSQVEIKSNIDTHKWLVTSGSG